ncbi:hypothetical protein CH35J_006185 [Colletotrichum higginsianum]|uniref:Uncharacterized protein n=1 Tax=Colletotrichum higginsianum TaxID=80884 RepID=A0A4T0W4I9_9PEZI|nr:hypothetical protein CH35J_006185 [Colletotrichum higginsianum]
MCEVHSKVVLYVILALRGIGLGFHALEHQPLAHPAAVAIVFAQSNGQTAASYQVRLATLWAFGGTAVVAAFLLRESLVWLIGRDHVEKTEESVTAKTRGTGGGGGGGDSGDPNMLWWIWTVLVDEEDDCWCRSLHLGAPPVQGRRHRHHRYHRAVRRQQATQLVQAVRVYNTDEADWGDKINFIVAGLGVVAFVTM